MFKETQKPKGFFREQAELKAEIFNGKPILKTETPIKTDEVKKDSIPEVTSAKEKWAEVQHLVENGKPVSPELFKESAHLAHVAHKLVKNTNKTEAKEMQDIEDTIKAIS